MEKEFGESTNAIRIELNRFEDAGLVKGKVVGGKKYYQANTKHPLYNDINNILKKVVGIDQIIERVTSQIGDLDAAYLTGNFAVGLDSSTIELLLVGQNLDNDYIKKLVAKAGKLMDRKISYMVLNNKQMKNFFGDKQTLLIWQKDDVS